MYPRWFLLERAIAVRLVLELLSPPLSTTFAYASQIGYLTVRVTSLTEEGNGHHLVGCEVFTQTHFGMRRDLLQRTGAHTSPGAERPRIDNLN